MENLLFLNIGVNEFFLLITVLFLCLIPLFLMVIAFVDLFRRDFKYNSLDRLLIGLLILFTPILGSLIYLITIRKHFQLKIPTY
ncbi:PLDc N-terminal domain-containing protein [Sphingobacterium bovistauri]|uniref:PLDc N-terminal domain-containing protein n=1 Tax=Sphingobacterium bovistauri TaxID=2781959 RepID=A0ABS7Z6R9_9SPHI|nr:PLDc N-terminal domain-containing protein [Sphingobacterium bovistauri]